jgi:hypothetical protein
MTLILVLIQFGMVKWVAHYPLLQFMALPVIKTSIKFLFFVSFLIGMLSIAKAGSRSPVVVLALVTIFSFWQN